MAEGKNASKPNTGSVLLQGHRELVTGVALSPSNVNQITSSCAGGLIKVPPHRAYTIARQAGTKEPRSSTEAVSASRSGDALGTARLEGTEASLCQVWDLPYLDARPGDLEAS